MASMTCSYCCMSQISLRSRSRPSCKAGSAQHHANFPLSRRNALLGALAFGSTICTSSESIASGIESIQSPSLALPDLASMSDDRKIALDKADESFENSEILKTLRAQSAANKEKNAKAISNKYCYRQAELGIGDCGGLKLIPGMTDSGKQRTPAWLAKLLGAEVEKPPPDDAPTLRSLLGAPEE